MNNSRLPSRVGVGFKPEHFASIISAPQPIGFFEVHAENYMGAGGPPHAQLSKLREDYAFRFTAWACRSGRCRIWIRTTLVASEPSATATNHRAFRAPCLVVA